MQITIPINVRRSQDFHSPRLEAHDCRRYSSRQEIGPNGQLVTKHEIVTYHPSDNMDIYKVSDFSIVNLQNIGADLNPRYAVNNDRFSVMDTASRMFTSLDKIKVIDEIQK